MELKRTAELEPYLRNHIERIKKKLNETDYAIYDHNPDKALSDLYEAGATILEWIHANAMVENWWSIYDDDNKSLSETERYRVTNELHERLVKSTKTYLKAYRTIEHLNGISEKLGLGNIISENTASALRRICGIRKE